MHLNQHLPPYIELRLALPCKDAKHAKEPEKRRAPSKADEPKKKARTIIDLTGDTPTPEDKPTFSQPTSSEKEELSSESEVAYIQLNESSPYYYLRWLK